MAQFFIFHVVFGCSCFLWYFQESLLVGGKSFTANQLSRFEADTRSTVDDDVDLGLQHLTILLAQAELVDDEVAAHWDDFLAHLLH